jgi:urea transport system ATP-binding protein
VITFYPSGKQELKLTGMKEHQIVNAGVGRKFQVPSVFANLSVFDNMLLSLKGHKGVWESLFYRISDADKSAIAKTLALVGLEERRDENAGMLAHGQKQWLEIAMQLLQKPELVMLDEPAAGMGSEETYRTGVILQEIKKDCSVIVVEHDMGFVRQIADAVTVLHEGKVLAEGSVDEVLANETVQAVYLGRGGEQ